MNLKAWLELHQEIKIEVDGNPSEIIQSIDIVYSLLRRIDDAHIASMPSRQRELICEALLKQADRYRGSQ